MADEVRVTYDSQERRAKLVVSVPVDANGVPVDFSASLGAPTDAAWDGVAASASVISLLKAIATNTAGP